MPEDNKFDAPELSQEVKAELQELVEDAADDGYEMGVDLAHDGTESIEGVITRMHDAVCSGEPVEAKPLGRLYEYHKKVHAAQIVKVRARRHDGVILELEDGAFAGVTHEWADRHKPQGGGYYVTYEDGYISYSPQFVFENGYHLSEGGEG